MDEPARDTARRLKLLIEYDGTDFVGWQAQPNGRTVQETIQRAFLQFTASDAAVVGSGRTDAGVHARGQVAHVVVRSDYSCKKILEALNGILPDDIAVLQVEDAGETFHARYSARERRYSYTISTRPAAIDRKTMWRVRYALSVGDMNACAALLVGDHDFKTFTSSESDADHHRCSVAKAEWTALADRLIFRIHANRFLHTMVRSLVGSMVDVGRGYATVEQFRVALESGDRRRAGPTAPAQGLVLEEVVYE
jgi:tRNA pseudouridine38-40 synthase